ncbi:SSI family serine proteinase inhibitor, partial [Streptomyces alkaliterrae]
GRADGKSLTIVVKDDVHAKERRLTLRCEPTGGNHPRAEEACAAVDRATRGVRSPWEPVSADTMCTQMHGGPQTARVTGTWAGRKVDASFDRSNGCEIARWDSLTPALPEVR